MIIEYHRPKTLEEALKLLGRTNPVTVPLAGGSSLNKPSPEPLAVVDLQDLNLNGMQVHGNSLELGATLTLQSLHDQLEFLPALKQAILHEATHNLRQVASVAGTLVAADGRSPFSTALLALGASLRLLPGEGQATSQFEELSLGDLLPFRPERLRGRLITQITLPANAQLAYEYVARSPADWPLVCAAIAVWPSGRTRVALGGFGPAPLLAFDGSEAQGVEAAASSAYSQAGDQWASAEYRSQVAAVLARRALLALSQPPGH